MKKDQIEQTREMLDIIEEDKLDDLLMRLDKLILSGKFKNKSVVLLNSYNTTFEPRNNFKRINIEFIIPI